MFKAARKRAGGRPGPRMAAALPAQRPPEASTDRATGATLPRAAAAGGFDGRAPGAAVPRAAAAGGFHGSRTGAALPRAAAAGGCHGPHIGCCIGAAGFAARCSVRHPGRTPRAASDGPPRTECCASASAVRTATQAMTRWFFTLPYLTFTLLAQKGKIVSFL